MPIVLYSVIMVLDVPYSIYIKPKEALMFVNHQLSVDRKLSISVMMALGSYSKTSLSIGRGDDVTDDPIWKLLLPLPLRCW